MKILILIPIWGRPEITEIMAENLCLWRTSDITVLTILSTEDKYIDRNRQIITERGFQTCIYPNLPLGEKLNAGITLSLDFKWDYLMNLGSDDLIHPGILPLFEPFYEKKQPFFGLEQVFFINFDTKKTRISEPNYWGAGRMIQREIIEKIQAGGEMLYNNKSNRGLDTESMLRVKSIYGLQYERVTVNNFPYIVDIKTFNSLNDWEILGNVSRECKLDLRNYYPKYITDMIYV